MNASLILRLVAALLIAVFCAAIPAWAQDSPQSPTEAVDDAMAPALPRPGSSQSGTEIEAERTKLDGLAVELTGISKQISASSTDDQKLVALKGRLDAISREILEAAVAFRPRLSEINTRLDQLGPAPADGQPAEPEAVAEERNRLVREKAEINALIGEQEDIALTTAKLSDDIAAMRRDLFTRRLLERVDLRQTLQAQVFADTADMAEGIWRKVSSWLRFAVSFKLNAVLAVLFFSLLAAYLILFLGRQFFYSLRERIVGHTEPSYLDRVSAAFWSTVIPTMALTVFLGLTYTLLDQFGILTGSMPELIGGLFNVIGVIYFVRRLSTSLLRPRQRAWRLFPVTDAAAYRLRALVVAMAGVVGLDFLVSVGARVQSSPLGVSILSNTIAVVLVGILILIIAGVKLFENEEGAATAWGRGVRALLYLLALFPIAAALLGYLGLAIYASRQIVVNGAFVVTAIIGFMTASAVGQEDALSNTRIGRWLRRHYNLTDTSLDRFGILAGVVVNILVVVIVLPLILLQLGFQPADLANFASVASSDIQIGSVSFSLVGILSGIVVFIIGFFLTRLLQGWLDRNVMARGRVETGVRNSVRTAVGYAGVAIAALFGVSAAGIDLSNLALVAGALSLGIGFGLQNIVSNFVSGLILLAERPIKVGDWIEAGGVSGTVKRINVRATEIETFQRQTVIMPNSELINAAVGNWMHKNKLGRGEVAIGVAYGTDPKLVKELLLEIAQGHPLVLKVPEPFVAFMDFGASSLDFEIRFYLADIGNRLDVSTDIRFAIVEKFAEHGIGIPFPQRDLNITPASVEALSRAFSQKPGTAAAKRVRSSNPDTASAAQEDGAAPKRRRRRKSSYGDMD
ncbi:MAG: mechanosensitive ion channel family protein [Brucellaceae bacterium]|nr:mechanosensitive ion channel family protein [Brucellaceae bacterium]